MNSLALSMAVLAASTAAVAPAFSASAARIVSSDASPARRSESGAQTSARVTARIIAQSARIGDGYPAPQAGMMLRPTQLAATDGSSVPALIYDFE